MFRSISMRLSVFAAVALAIPFSLAAAPALSADLAAAHAEAVALRASADNLMMLARTPMKYSFEAHASELARARRLADRIHERVQRMNAVRTDATPAQREEIDAMQVRLSEVAGSVDVAIRAFNDRHGVASLYSDAYQSVVEDLYNGAKALAASDVVKTASAD